MYLVSSASTFERKIGQVHERDLVAREGEAAVFVDEVLDLVREEDELGGRHLGRSLLVGRGRAQGEAGELHAAVDRIEEPLAVLEIKQAGERRAVDEILEEELRRVVGRNSARHDAADAPSGRHAITHRLCEDREEIHFAAAA
jgi:hypothetical protein